MVLSDLADGTAVFLDANIFVYHFSGVSAECRTLLERTERKAIQAVTGAHIILEVLHRLMILEAVAKGLITPGQPAKKLKQKPDVIRRLSDYSRCVAEIRRLPVRVYPVTLQHVRNSEPMRIAHGLMTNDSVTATMMMHYRVSDLASLDSDLKRVTTLKVYQPSDVP